MYWVHDLCVFMFFISGIKYWSLKWILIKVNMNSPNYWKNTQCKICCNAAANMFCSNNDLKSHHKWIIPWSVSITDNDSCFLRHLSFHIYIFITAMEPISLTGFLHPLLPIIYTFNVINMYWYHCACVLNFMVHFTRIIVKWIHFCQHVITVFHLCLLVEYLACFMGSKMTWILILYCLYKAQLILVRVQRYYGSWSIRVNVPLKSGAIVSFAKSYTSVCGAWPV